MRGGEAFIVAKSIFPPRAPPLRPRSFVVRCGDVCMYWWGDGCCGIGYKTLCRFIPILHNFLQSITYSPQTTRKLSLSSTPSSSSNSRETTQPHTLNRTPTPPLYPHALNLTARTATSTSRLEKPAGKASVQQLRIPDSIPGTGVRSPPPPSSHEKKNLL